MSEEAAYYSAYLQHTLPFEEVYAEDYDAFFVVGGYGVMWDLSHNSALQRLLLTAFGQGKVLSAVCHGAAALAYLRLSNGAFILHGRHVTGFSNNEESAIGLRNVMPFSVEDALKRAGVHYSCELNWQSHVVVDGQFITGQNPASALAVSQVIVTRLLS